MKGDCKACGATGDKFDNETNDWAWPREDCPKCEGTGEDLSDEYPVAE